MTISRRVPPLVAQTSEDSCWAAALESWSRVDPRIPDRHEKDLVRLWGEGPRGGITAATKLPVIAAAMGLTWGCYQPYDLVSFLEQHLPTSHVFCAYCRGGGFSHAVVIYRLSDRGNISFMDPDGGRDRWRSFHWFVGHAPFALMCKL